MPDGAPTVTISLAVGQDYKDKQGVKHEQTEWIRLVAFNRLAEVCRDWLHKGDKIYAEGKWKTRKWDDPKTGATRYSTECILSQMEMLGSKTGGSGAAPGQAPSQAHSQAPAGSQVPADYDDNSDDIPF